MSPPPRDVIRPGQGIDVGKRSGTLGCFARMGSQNVLLSNAHVLFGDERNPVLREVRTTPGSSCCSRGWLLARVHGTASSTPVVIESRRPATTFEPESHVTETGVLTDCAVAVLEPGVRFSNEIPSIGMIAGTVPPDWEPPSSGFRADPTEEQYVRMYSPMQNCVKYGTIARRSEAVMAWYVRGGVRGDDVPLYLSNSATVRTAPRPLAQYVVFPRPNPAEGRYPDVYLNHVDKANDFRWGSLGDLTFGLGGDSGSIVVNHRNQVVGLFWGAVFRNEMFSTRAQSASDFGAEMELEFRAALSGGVVTPIAHVLEQLHITIPPDLANTAPSDGEGFAADPEWEALQRGLARLRTALEATPAGQLLAAKVAEHGPEARRLVNTVREVGVNWQRHRGPAFVRFAAEHLSDPARRIPTAIDGVERTRLLERMADLFLRHGSEPLRRDVARYRAFVTERLADATTLEEVISGLGEGARPGG